MRADWRAVLALCAALSGCALAQGRDRAGNSDDDGKPWREIEAQLPAYPNADDLLPFDAGGASPHRFFLDARSLAISEDGVVRYTLVVKSAGGATNVTYEGMRCETRQQKLYAVGQADGQWVRARNPQWRRIETQAVDRRHAALYQDFLCAGPGRKSPITSVGEALQKLKYPTPATAE